MATSAPVREVVEYAIGGGWGEEFESDESVRVSVIRGTDFERLGHAEFESVPCRFEKGTKVPQRLLRPGDVVLEVSGGSASSGQYTGRSLYVTREILSALGDSVIPASFCRLVRFDATKVDSRYAYYCFQDMYKSGRARFYELQSTGINNFQFEQFLDSEIIRLPPLPEQRAIAHILGTLDDKIDNNRRMSATLEAMARALFQAWFVDFEPVRAKMAGRPSASAPGDLADLFPDRLVPSELGEIPEGWRVGRLGELCRAPQYGYTASANDSQIGPHLLRITDINKEAWITWQTVPYCLASHGDRAKYGLRAGDIVIARMADPGHGALIEENVDAVFASYLIRFVPEQSEYGRYLQYWLRSDGYWGLVGGRKVGTTRPTVNAKLLAALPVLIPPLSIASQFAQAAGTWREGILARIRESQTLAVMRDALLSRLVSGRLPVAEIEEQTILGGQHGSMG